MKKLVILLTVLFFSSASLYADISKADETIALSPENAFAAFRIGKFGEAAELFKKAIPALSKEENPDKYLEACMGLAESYKALGYHQRALSALNEAMPALRKSKDRYRNSLFLSALADLHNSLGNIEEMIKCLNVSVTEARLSKNPRIIAAVLNDMGNGLAMIEYLKNALASYDEAIELIKLDNSDTLLLKSKILVNKTRVLYLLRSYEKFYESLEAASIQTGNLPDSYEKAVNFISLTRLLIEVLRNKSEIDSMTAKISFVLAYRMIDKALLIAQKLKNSRLISISYGYWGELYEMDYDYEEAKKKTRSAIFFALHGDFAEILYLWQWQMSRILAAQGVRDKAIKFYKKSINTLNPIRSELFTGYRHKRDFFNSSVKPVYLGLAELLVLQAEEASSKKTRDSKLYEARDTMEILKTAELENFFQDECAVRSETKGVKIERTPEKTALLYPISMPDSLILLVTMPDGIRHKLIRMKHKELRDAARRLRRGLQNRTSRSFIHQARKLYDCLIRPIEDWLSSQNIETLVVAPDGVLRLIPFSTLYDGKHFLIEKYAIATIPAISLTEASRFDPANAKILITGLSDKVQGFSALPSVSGELEDIKKIMGEGTVYYNKEHNLANLTDEFKNNSYSIVHMATHGVFGGTPEKTFLLLYDEKLDMNRLSRLIDFSRFQGNRVELLTLSACQTALGDERAALGLAGVAVKAGVKSVIATLWFVDDEATSFVVREFYRQLKTRGILKAKALQNAQKILIQKKRYKHPAYWAPFLLIGNWM